MIELFPFQSYNPITFIWKEKNLELAFSWLVDKI